VDNLELRSGVKTVKRNEWHRTTCNIIGGVYGKCTPSHKSKQLQHSSFDGGGRAFLLWIIWISCHKLFVPSSRSGTPEVHRAISDCRETGIRVLVITGDDKNTTESHMS